MGVESPRPAGLTYKQQQHNLLTSRNFYPFFLQNAAIAKTEVNVTVLQGTRNEGTATGIGITEVIVVTEETETVKGTAMEAADEMTDVSPLERDTVAVHETMMTIRDVLPIMKMTDVEVAADTVVAATTTGEVSVVDEVDLLEMVDAMVAAEKHAARQKRTAWAHRNDDHQHPKAPYLFPNGRGRHQAGTFMPLDMSNIQLFRPNRQVSRPFLSFIIY